MEREQDHKLFATRRESERTFLGVEIIFQKGKKKNEGRRKTRHTPKFSESLPVFPFIFTLSFPPCVSLCRASGSRSWKWKVLVYVEGKKCMYSGMESFKLTNLSSLLSLSFFLCLSPSLTCVC